MLTAAEIKKKLKIDPLWEPNEHATDEEWELFELIKLEEEQNLTPAKEIDDKEHNINMEDLESDFGLDPDDDLEDEFDIDLDDLDSDTDWSGDEEDEDPSTEENSK